MNLIKAIYLELKKKIYHLFKIPLYTPKQKELFDEVQIGDIIFCKMPLSELELLKIPEGHRARPYLVADKKGSVLICFPGSHKKWNKVSLTRQLVVKKIVYPYYTNTKGNESRSIYDSYFDLTNLSFVPIENMNHKSMSINDYYMKQLATKVAIMKNQGSLVYNFQLPYELKVEEGMIYEYQNQDYYIYSIDRENLYGYAISRVVNSIPVEYLGKKRYIHYENKIHMIDDHTFPIKGMVSSEGQLEIESLINQERKEVADRVHKIPQFNSKYPVGTIFYAPFQDEKLIYLFSNGKKDYGIYLDELERICRLEDLKYYQNTKECYPPLELAELLENMEEPEYEDDNHIYVNYLIIKLKEKEDESK